VYGSPNIIRMIKSGRMMGRARSNLGREEERKCVSMGKLEGKRPIGRSRRCQSVGEVRLNIDLCVTM
jgi:hypothetical protein